MLAQLVEGEKVAAGIGRLLLPGIGEDGGNDRRASRRRLPDLVCVISVPPGGLAQARYICRRLRAKLPATPILVIRPGAQERREESSQRLMEDGAGQVCFTLEEARTSIERQLMARR